MNRPELRVLGRLQRCCAEDANCHLIDIKRELVLAHASLQKPCYLLMLIRSCSMSSVVVITFALA